MQAGIDHGNPGPHHEEEQAFPPRCRSGSRRRCLNSTTMARVLLQLVHPGALPRPVRAVLQAMGNLEARPSHAELPGLYLVETTDTEQDGALIDALNALPEVRYAERENFGEAW
jgi:hypothetical protein